MDNNSSYGTYIVRNGQGYELNGQPFVLEHDDKIYLGDPNYDESVELIYEQPVQAAAEVAP